MITRRELLSQVRYEPGTGLFFHATTGKPVHRAGNHKSRYRLVRINGVAHQAHRMAWLAVHGELPAGVIDHINGDGHDNRISNLRDVSQMVNTQNRIKPASMAGFIGVTAWNGKFRARITVLGKPVDLGYYQTAEEAGAAYMTAKREMHSAPRAKAAA